MATLSVRDTGGHSRRVAIYFAETYLSRERGSELERITGSLRDVLPVRHLFSFFVPDDEIAFHCLQGPSPDAIRHALEHAGLVADRIVPADPVLRVAGLDSSGDPT